MTQRSLLMCGRFVRQKDIETLAEDFGVEFAPSLLEPSYNIAPTQQVAVLIEDGFKMLIAVRGGLAPSWASDNSIGKIMINSTAGTDATKPSLTRAISKQPGR